MIPGSIKFQRAMAATAPTLHTRCRCGVPMNNKDKALYCMYETSCPRSHEHDPVKWAKVKQESEGERA